MKKVFATLILVASFVCAYGQDYAEITMSRTDMRTRSIVEVPEASISHEVLRVSFSSSGIYSLTVSDSMGSPVYISSLPADGMGYVPAAVLPFCSSMDIRYNINRNL